MGRRKKEPRDVHRANIASAAQLLFMERGMEATSMDDIAKAAGYSKATLYVYFKNKEEIIDILVLESMKKLHACLSATITQQNTAKARYNLICQSLVEYQEEFPFYFKIVLDKINVDFETETYSIGEEINETLKLFLMEGIAANEIRADIEIMPTIFAFWGMLSGFIQLAASKEGYIAMEMQVSKKQFLAYGFTMLYQSIALSTRTS